MKKLYLIKNPELFQGEIYLKSNKNYFEDWYFQNTSNNNSIAFIPGISIHNGQKKAFIQIITKFNSYFIDYTIEEFKFSDKPFYIKIGNNYFSKDGINIYINANDLVIFGKLKYSNQENIKTSLLSPNIMGPFSYIPFTECNHAIINVKNNINGSININNKKIIFNNGYGYIEKDWGYSFPKSYIWTEGIDFKNSNASFMLSSAEIPFKISKFNGIICVLKINND